jgi:hypothetical protein
MSPYKPIETLFKEPIMTTIEQAAAREAYHASMAYEPGQPFLDRERDARQDNALANLRAAELAAETRPAKIIRLLREAKALDAQADNCIIEGAEFAGLAAMRRLRFGEDEGFAAVLQQKAEARDRLAIKYGDQAFALKLERTGLILQEDMAAQMTAIVGVA